MKQEVFILNEERNVTLTTYILDVEGEHCYVKKRPLVLVLPGGAYMYCSGREAEPVAFSYLNAGYHVAILRYSVAEHAVWPNPLKDYEQAMDLIYDKAEEWKVYTDKIAVIGFSAGGHLAAAAATMGKKRPNAAILGYSVVTSDVKACLPSAPDTVLMVDEHTPPCFLFHTRNDNTVSVMNSVKFMEALAEHDITFESHIYSYGPHGYSTCDSSIQGASTEMSHRVQNWVPDSIGWLREVLGDFDDVGGGMSEPIVATHITGDAEPFLSVDCTLGCLQKNPMGQEMLQGLLAQLQQNAGEAEAHMELTPERVQAMNRLKLCDVFRLTGVPEQVTESVNAQLQQISNK